MSTKQFKTKIPAKFHQDIFEWYSTGLSKTGIMLKLEKEHSYHTHERTLARLLAHLKSEAQAITSAVIAQQTQQNVLGDFQELQRLYNEVKEVAQTAKGSDNNLHLRAVDRLTKLLGIKFGISTKEDKKEEVDQELIAEGLIEKLGK